MSFDHVAEKTDKDIDPLFNLMSIKYKLLMDDQQCDFCGVPASEWSIIRLCHDVLCKECMDDINSAMKFCEIIRCQRCNIVFDPVKDVTTNHDMKLAYYEMEDFLWKVVALEHGILDKDFEKSFLNKSDVRSMDAYNLHTNSIQVNNNNVMQDTIKNDEGLKSSNIHINSLSSEAKSLSNQTIKNLILTSEELDMIGIEPIRSSPESDISEQQNQFNHVSLTSPTTDFNREKKPIKNVNVAKRVKDLVTSKLKNSQINNLSIITDSTENNLHKKLKMSDDQSTDSSSSSSESEEDVIEGTPDRCHVSDPTSSFKHKNKNIVITYTNLETDDELDVLRELVHLFQLHAHTSWSDRVTHLVVKTLNDGTCLRTRKYVNALLSNCFIVTFEWAKDCLRTKSLRPELDYMPVDMCGEPSPMVSWRVGRGIIESPMEWTSKCILYFHSSVEFNESYSDVVGWAKKAGFVLTNEMGEFKGDEFRMRIILADVSSSEDPRARLPNENEITRWMYDYKAVTIFVDWFLECLFRYRFVEINPRFQVIKLDSNVVEYTNMNESLFQFEF